MLGQQEGPSEGLNSVTWNGSNYFAYKKNQIIKNITSKGLTYWIFFCVFIPILLIALFYLLPQSVKDSIFILSIPLTNPLSLIFNGYIHTKDWHIWGNLQGYIIAIVILLILEDNKDVLKYSSLSFLVLVPIVTSISTIMLYSVIGITGTSQGFSGIVAAFNAYAMYSIFRFGLEDFNTVDLSALKTVNRRKKAILTVAGIVIIILLGSAGAMVLDGGLSSGLYTPTATGVTNGIAHFSGFLCGLIIPLILSLKYRRVSGTFTKMLNSLFIFITLVAIICYARYLSELIRVVTSM